MATIRGNGMEETLSVDEMHGYDKYVQVVSQHGRSDIEETEQEKKSIEEFSAYEREQAQT